MHRPSLFLAACAALLAVAACFTALAAENASLRKLELDGRLPAVYYAPPEGQTSARPLFIMLHGMCALPEYECPVFRSGATAHGWLLCPAGPQRCGGGGAMWVGGTRTLVTAVGAAKAALLERHGARVDATRQALIGYSLGAPAALRIALAEPGRYQALMFVNASVQPSASELKKAGVKRIALVAGDRDGSAQKLRRAAQRLERAGVDARFFSLGPVGHYFDASSEARMLESLRWLGAGL